MVKFTHMAQTNESAKDFIGKIVTVKIDRQLGTKHPKHDLWYMANYGFISNTTSPDGEEIDAYVLGVFQPVEEFTGKCIAVIHRTNDNDDKVVVVPEDREYSDQDIKVLTEFQEKYFKSEIVR